MRATTGGGFLIALIVLVCTACGGANADGDIGDDKRTDGRPLEASDRAAIDFLDARLGEHFMRGPDGWTTQFQQYNLVGEVMPDRTPELLFKQFRVLKYTVKPDYLTEAMKLNGVDYRAIATFKDSPARTFRTAAGWGEPQGWSQWQDSTLAFTTIAIERRNGAWMTSDSDLFQGIRPTLDVP